MRKNMKKKVFAAKGGPRNGQKLSVDKDPFFSNESRKRKKTHEDHDEIESSDSDDDKAFMGSDGERDNNEDEFKEETADEKRRRLATEYLDSIREITKREKTEDRETEDNDDSEGERDSLVSKLLQREQQEDSGRVRRLIALKIQKPKPTDKFQILVNHRQSVSGLALSDDDLKGFSASKDGTILHWDVEYGKTEKYKWPSDEGLKSHGMKDPQGGARKKHSKQVLALAVSSDGRYLASGGLDRHVHLWDTRSREHIQAFPGHRAPVSCLTFRQGSFELFSGSYDRSVKIWNVEDRSYISTLFGHQSEILTIDSLRKERVLTVGRDRSMQLHKVPEESRLVFRSSTSSLECCCFTSNDEFLTGSDDGSIELWSMLKKKPTYIVRNAHAFSLPLSNNSSACSWVSSVSVCQTSDLAASGAGNGLVQLWAIDGEKKAVRPLYDLPLDGFVNSLTFAKSGKFLLAGVGQVPRLGRWGQIQGAKNGVFVHPLNLS